MASAWQAGGGAQASAALAAWHDDDIKRRVAYRNNGASGAGKA